MLLLLCAIIIAVAIASMCLVCFIYFVLPMIFYYIWYRRAFPSEQALLHMWSHLKIHRSNINLATDLKRIYDNGNEHVPFLTMFEFFRRTIFVWDYKLIENIRDQNVPIFYDDKIVDDFFLPTSPSSKHCRLADELYHSQYGNHNVRRSMAEPILNFGDQTDIFVLAAHCTNQLCLHLERMIDIPAKKRERYRIAYSMEKYVAYLIKSGVVLVTMNNRTKVSISKSPTRVSYTKQPIIHSKPNLLCLFYLNWHKCGSMLVQYISDREWLNRFICGGRNIFNEMCEFFNDTLNRLIVLKKNRKSLNPSENLLKLIICPNPNRDMEDIDWYFAPHGYRQEMNVAAEYTIAAIDEGFATISTTLTFLLYEMAKNQDIQHVLYSQLCNDIAELAAAVEAEGFEEVEDEEKETEFPYDSIMYNDYLECCVNEILRKYPPQTYFKGQNAIEYRIMDSSNIIIPESNIYFSILGAHHDDRIYYNPLQFNPDRFLDGREPDIYFPYGFDCRGRGADLVEGIIKFALANLILKFQFTPINGETIGELKFNESDFVRQRYDIKINISKRVKGVNVVPVNGNVNIDENGDTESTLSQPVVDERPASPVESISTHTQQSLSNMSSRSVVSSSTSGRGTKTLTSSLGQSADSGHPTQTIPISSKSTTVPSSRRPSIADTIHSSLSPMQSDYGNVVIAECDFHAPVSATKSDGSSSTISKRRSRLSSTSSSASKGKYDFLTKRKWSQPSTPQQPNKSAIEDYNRYMLTQQSTSRYQPPARAQPIQHDIEMSLLNRQRSSQSSTSANHSPHILETELCMVDKNSSKKNSELDKSDKNKINEQQLKKQEQQPSAESTEKHQLKPQKLSVTVKTPSPTSPRRLTSQPQVHTLQETPPIVRPRPRSSPNLPTRINILGLEPPPSKSPSEEHPTSDYNLSTSAVINIPASVENISCASGSNSSRKPPRPPKTLNLSPRQNFQRKKSYHIIDIPQLQATNPDNTSPKSTNTPPSTVNISPPSLPTPARRVIEIGNEILVIPNILITPTNPHEIPAHSDVAINLPSDAESSETAQTTNTPQMSDSSDSTHQDDIV